MCLCIGKTDLLVNALNVRRETRVVVDDAANGEAYGRCRGQGLIINISTSIPMYKSVAFSFGWHTIYNIYI